MQINLIINSKKKARQLLINYLSKLLVRTFPYNELILVIKVREHSSPSLIIRNLKFAFLNKHTTTLTLNTTLQTFHPYELAFLMQTTNPPSAPGIRTVQAKFLFTTDQRSFTTIERP